MTDNNESKANNEHKIMRSIVPSSDQIIERLISLGADQNTLKCQNTETKKL